MTGSINQSALWREITIGDCIRFSGGSQPNKKHFIYEMRPGYIRLLQTRDFKSDKYATYIPEELSNKKCKKDDIMIGRYGPPLFQVFRGKEGAYNVALLKAIPNEELINKNYAFYFLSQKKLRTYLEGLSQRSGGQTGVEMDKLLKYPIVLPPLENQLQIVEILSTWDDAIETIEELIRKKRDMKRSLADTLFRNLEKRKLSDFFDIIMGQSPSSDSYNEEQNGLPFIGGNADIQNKKTKPRFFTAEITKTALPNDVILTVRAPVGEVAQNKIKVCIGRGVCAIRPRTAFDSTYIYQVLLYNQSKWLSLEQGSTFTAVNSADIKNFPIQWSIDENKRKSIANILDVCDSELELLYIKLEMFEKQKKGLTQLLLGGKNKLGKKYDQ